jgi:RimJ/RimL family protein N-acetyltransferase
LQLIVDYGFSDRYTPFNHNIPLERIVASINETNEGSVKVVKKCGFYLEALQRKSHKKEGKIHNSFLYVKLRSMDD